MIIVNSKNCSKIALERSSILGILPFSFLNLSATMTTVSDRKRLSSIEFRNLTRRRLVH